MFIQLNNHKAHLYTKNPIDSSKKSIIFLPGAGMDHRTLSMFKLSKIENTYNVIAIDLPGHGYTSGPLFYDVEEHSQFCIELFKKMNHELSYKFDVEIKLIEKEVKKRA